MHRTLLKSHFSISMLCLFIFVSACGMNNPTSSSSQGNQSGTRPLGIGMTPEPGTDGKPAVPPTGHYESMVASSGVDFVGSDNGEVYALDGSTGSLRWRFDARNPVSVAAVADGVVYVYANSDSSAVAYALRASDGGLLWRYPVGDYVSQEMVADGAVYLGTAATANQPRLYVLQASSGELLWHYDAHSIIPGLLAVSDGVAYYAELSGIDGNAEEAVTALRASNGHLLWRLSANSENGALYGLSQEVDGAVYLSTMSGSVYAVRATNGVVLWHVARVSLFKGPPSVVVPMIANGIVYVLGQPDTGDMEMLYALRASDGKTLWTASLDRSPGPPAIQPQLVNGVLYLSGFAGVTALRASDGAALWWHAGDQPFGPFIVGDGRVYVNSSGGIYALNASTGALLWRQAIPNHSSEMSNSTPLLVADSHAYVSSEDGIVWGYNAIDGQALWRYTIQELAVPTQPAYEAQVTFSDSTSFAQALKTITDLGLQTEKICIVTWRPQQSSQFYSSYHSLDVAATAASAPLWLARLQASPGVTAVQAFSVINCPMERLDNNPPFLGPDRAGTYLRVTFTSASYDAALNEVNDLGFRLANPCYEQARAHGDKPTWKAMGQESSYAQGRVLLLATTPLNATIWQSQLQSLPGAVHVEMVKQNGC
jgi:outer membrane protein assembly factor BamB